jgi:general secretion pathway protein D
MKVTWGAEDVATRGATDGACEACLSSAPSSSSGLKRALAWVATLAVQRWPLMLPVLLAGGFAPIKAADALRDPTRPDMALRRAMEEGGGLGGGRLKIEAEEGEPDQEPMQRRLALIDVAGVAFGDVARMLALETGLNLAPSVAASTNVVTMRLAGLPAGVVLETLCTSHGMWMRRDATTGVVRVYAASEFRRDLESMREERTEVFTLLYPNATDIAQAISDVFGDRVSVSGLESDDGGMMDLQQRLQRFDLLDQRASGLGMAAQGSGLGGGGLRGGAGGMGVGMGMGMGMGGMNGWGGMGMGAGTSGSRGRATAAVPKARDLAVGGTDLNAEQVQGLAGGVQPGGAVNPLATERMMGRRVGIHVAVLRRQNRLVVRTADEEALRDIRMLVGRLDVAQSMVLLDVRVLRVQLGDGFNSAFDYSFLRTAGDGMMNGAWTTGEIQGPPAMGAGALGGVGAGSMRPGGGGFDSQSMVFQYLGKDVRARLSLLETRGRLRSVATPLLLTANQEVSRVFVGEEVPIVRGFSGGATIPTGGSGVVAQNANAQVEFRPVGTTLLLTPNINADRTVTLRLVQENSSLRRQGASIPVPSEGGGFRSLAVDVVQSRAVSGTFMAQHAESVVVGGLVEEQETDDRSGVPWLGRLPGVGAAFRRDARTRGRSELVVIVRPFIVSTPAEAEAISVRLAKEVSLEPRTWDGRAGSGYSTNDVVAPRHPKPDKKPRNGKPGR